jgi:FlaA1/EpsC-like NDP-sugar epimerase
MVPLRRRILLTAFKLSDVLIMVSMFALATAVVYLQNNGIAFHEFLQMRFKIENYALFSGFVLLWHLILSAFDLYHSRRFSSTKAEIKDLLIAIALGTLVIWLCALIFNIQIVTPLFLVVFAGGTAILSIASRLVLRRILKMVRIHGRNLRFMLIAGTNERARNLARTIESKPELGYQLLGFVDDQ